MSNKTKKFLEKIIDDLEEIRECDRAGYIVDIELHKVIEDIRKFIR